MGPRHRVLRPDDHGVIRRKAVLRRLVYQRGHAPAEKGIRVHPPRSNGPHEVARATRQDHPPRLLQLLCCIGGGRLLRRYVGLCGRLVLFLLRPQRLPDLSNDSGRHHRPIPDLCAEQNEGPLEGVRQVGDNPV